jgi:hypothetical protein
VAEGCRAVLVRCAAAMQRVKSLAHMMRRANSKQALQVDDGTCSDDAASTESSLTTWCVQKCYAARKSPHCDHSLPDFQTHAVGLAGCHSLLCCNEMTSTGAHSIQAGKGLIMRHVTALLSYI